MCRQQLLYAMAPCRYEGVWHYDGEEENIVAVVLYYLRYSASLVGGDIEFAGRFDFLPPCAYARNHYEGS